MGKDVGMGVGPLERAQHAGGGGPTPGHRMGEVGPRLVERTNAVFLGHC